MTPLEQAKDILTIPQIGTKLFPGWKPGKSCRSPFRKDKNPSFSVSDDGRLWNCFATGEGGDAVDFLAKALGLSNADACREFIRMAGVRAGAERPEGGARISKREDRKPVAHPAPPPWIPEPMPDDVARLFVDGAVTLAKDEALCRKVAEWRGWPDCIVKRLAMDAALSAPDHGGRKVLAWSVQCPAAGDAFDLLDVGIHLRMPTGQGGGHARWMFLPNEKSHTGRKVPACPAIWGDFPGAKLLVIAEGQWDAVSVGFAAGWFERDRWPDGVCLLGIRGAQGVRPFFEHYGRFWPASARALLFCDADEAGATWFTSREGKQSFAQELRARCSRVQVVRPTGGAKDFNDMLKAGAASRSTMSDTFKRLELGKYL